MKWPNKKKNQYAYSISVHKEAVHIAILKAVPAAVPADKGIDWQNTHWELIVNDDISVENENVPEALSALLKRYEKFATKRQALQLVLGTDLTEEVSVEKPELANEEIAAALQWTLKDLVKTPAADIIADFYDPAIHASGSKKIQVVVASRTFLQPLLDVLHAAQFDIQGIVNATLAFSRWFNPDEKLVVLTQSFRDVNQLHIIANNMLVISRDLNRIQPLTKIAIDDTSELEVLALEVQRSIDYYTGQLRQAPLSEICIATAHPQAADLVAVLGAQLGLNSGVLPYPAWAQELKASDYSDLPVLSGLVWLTRPVAENSGEPA
ncbi:hypothetical protein [Aliidiomarina quisquiliarum]|uniref:hypothetical protein n=1 Tax=Aliidiomarina quisquiliarum TaxID=2938947 RepID=UPI00208E6140|nr:hypothetical protein [Aliidiomarina quisquiliarum]MCO4322478.1 hypothetical protein [Aliidiomarina quisquiliarum]